MRMKGLVLILIIILISLGIWGYFYTYNQQKAAFQINPSPLRPDFAKATTGEQGFEGQAGIMVQTRKETVRKKH